MAEKIKTVKLEGKLKSAYTHTEKDDNGDAKKVTNIVSIYKDGLTIDGSDKVKEFFEEMYKDTVKKFVPDWFKDDKDYITVKSSFNIACKLDQEDRQLSFAEFCERGNIRGAEVILKCNHKPNALYPSAMLIVKEGEAYDAFKDF